MHPRASPALLDHTFNEAVGLLVAARDYLSYREPGERRRLGGAASLRASCEAFRVTSRLTQVMAWLMIQRAVHNGEVTPEEASAETHRLSGAEICLDGSATDDTALPAGLRDLLARSHRLYVRVARLDDLARRRAGVMDGRAPTFPPSAPRTDRTDP